MCMAFVFISSDPNGRYKLIILDNRDEMLDRETSELDWRDGILSGIDEKDIAKGTWFGINKRGRIGILLSITQPSASKNPKATSRGFITKSFLNTTKEADEYCTQLAATSHQYNGFQFLGFERKPDSLYRLQSVTSQFVDKVIPEKWNAGTYVFGNSPPSNPYQKVIYGKKEFDKVMKDVESMNKNNIIESLLKIATDRTSCFPDPQYQHQMGVKNDSYRALTSIYVKCPANRRYGTRSHSILIIDRDDNATFFERRMTKAPEDMEKAEWADKVIEFKIK